MPTGDSGSIVDVSEHTHTVAHGPGLPSLRLIEWIPSSRVGGMLRVRGELGDPAPVTPGAPVLALRDGDGTRTLAPALGDDASGGGGDGWRAAYLVATQAIAGAEALWLEWPDGARVALPAVDVTQGRVLGEAPAPAQVEAEVFDRAVLAERRAQRAENAQRAQARAAAEAVAALGALERRVEELTRERDELATRPAPADPAPVRLVPADAPLVESLREELEAARSLHREAEARERRESAALAEALSALGRLRLQASQLRLKLRTQMASASADSVRLAVLESEDRGFRARLREARGELESLRSRMAVERLERERLVADLDAERASGHRAQRERDELRDALSAERTARTRLESELGRRWAEGESSAAAVEQLRSEMSAQQRRAAGEAGRLRTRIEDLGRLLRAERVSRASLALDLKIARSRAGAARAQADVAAAQQTFLRAEAAAAIEELHVTRQALAEAQGRLRRAAAAAREAAPLEATSPSMAEDATATQAPAPGLVDELQERIAELQRAAVVDGEGWQQRASAHAPVAVTPSTDAAGVAARLDAAAASLRARVASDPAGAPAVRSVGADEAIVSAPAEVPDAGVTALVRRPLAAVVHTREPAVPSIAAGTRRLPSLRGALVRLAVEDPHAAARLLAGLLPAQGAFLAGDIDYDLTIREIGTFAITVTGGRTSVRSLRRPRSRRQAELHVTLHALTLAELLAGRSRRVGRMLAPVKVRGSRRRLAMLGELATARCRLRDLARAGAQLDPALLVRALPFAVDARDTDGHHFTIAQEIVDGTPRTWMVSVAGRRGLSVSTGPSDECADARVTMTRETFDRLLRGQRPDRAQKPWVRGDFAAVDSLRRWIEAALA